MAKWNWVSDEMNFLYDEIEKTVSSRTKIIKSVKDLSGKKIVRASHKGGSVYLSLGDGSIAILTSKSYSPGSHTVALESRIYAEGYVDAGVISEEELKAMEKIARGKAIDKEIEDLKRKKAEWSEEDFDMDY